MQAIRDGTFDLCIIGGGATGTGCALDAQLRGLSTVLLEAGDFVSHTSTASTKLVHGGVRYLQQAVNDFDYGQYTMVRKALHERIHILRAAPFLAHPLELLVPCFSRWELFYYTIGMKVYDWIAGKASLFPSRMLSKAESLRRMPSLRSEKLVGTVSYADGQFDDARFGLTLAQTFSQQGGELLNYARVTNFGKNSVGKLAVADVEDQLTGEHFEVHAKVFVNCTGPFADHIRLMANPAMPERLRLSKGVHLILPSEATQSESAMLVPKTEDGRVVFIIPWLGRLLVGTTDDEATLTDEMVVTPPEIKYLLKYVNKYLNVNLNPNDVVSAFAGLRPLVRSKNAVDTKKLIRDHEVEVDDLSGLVSVLGGKWTTYRAMAEDGINHAQQAIPEKQAPCRTLDFVLTGTEGFSPDYWKQLQQNYRVSSETARHLSQKFGTNSPKVLDLTKQEPELLQALTEGGAPILAEVVYVIREEMAQTIEDVLLRRIGVQFHSWKEASDAAPVVGQLLARELGWTDEQTDAAVAAYSSSIQHLFQSAGIERNLTDDVSLRERSPQSYGETMRMGEQMADYIGAIDQGTTSTRFMVFDRSGRIVSSVQKEHEQIYPKPGWVEHDPAEIWRRTQEVIREAMESKGLRPSDLAGIGITNQRETTLVWNKKTGQSVYNAIVWQDMRVQDTVAEFSANGGQDRYRGKTGLPLATYFSGLKLRWILNNVPGARAAAEAGDLLFGNIDTFLIWHLTGGVNNGVHVTDVTNASRTQLMDLETLNWDKDILAEFNIPASVLPRIVSSSEVYGKAILGPIKDVPIAGDLGDQQAALFGQACFKPGEAKNTYGTGCFMLLNTGHKAVPSKSGLLTTLAYKIGNKPAVYALEGSIAITGALVQWVRDNLSMIEKSQDIEALARTVPDNGGVYIVPAFSGLFAPYWKADARGVITGLTRFVNKGHMARAVLEATAFQVREVLDAMEKDSGIELENLRTDGGMVYNDLLMQFQADILNKPVVRPVVHETTALGAAYAAGLATGFMKDTDEVVANWAEDRRWNPMMAEERRASLYHFWKKAVTRSFDWVE